MANIGSDGEYAGDQYDNLFKEIISAFWNVKSDGDVESSTGFFALTEIPSQPGELAEFQSIFGDYTVIDDWPASGWYVTYENSDGIIFVYKFASQKDAEKAYEKLEQEFSMWASDSDEGDEGE